MILSRTGLCTNPSTLNVYFHSESLFSQSFTHLFFFSVPAPLPPGQVNILPIACQQQFIHAEDQTSDMDPMYLDSSMAFDKCFTRCP